MEVHDPQTGACRTAQIFIGVLGGSSYTFCEATWSQKLQDWIESHCRMFEYFCGVTQLSSAGDNWANQQHQIM
jgi:transposase